MSDARNRRRLERKAIGKLHIVREATDAQVRASRGPKGGDVCIGCVHLPPPADCHWYYVENFGFTPPGGEPMTANWVLVCEKCFVESSKHPGGIMKYVKEGKLQIGAHLIWPKDDEPEPQPS